MTALLSDSELLRRLVAFDTTSRHSNLPLADFLSDYLDRPGIRVRRLPSPDGLKANLVVTCGPEVDEDERGGLVLSGHMDVVPADEAGWRSDPFVLVEADGAYVGRGACDMKGFVALAVNRAAALDPARLRAPLALVLTYDEELGTLGARHLVETWPAGLVLPRAAVIGEPTSLRPVRMHKGHLKLRLVFHGRSAHSGYPHLGVNAIEPAGHAIVALGRLRDTLAAERPPAGEHFAEVPFVALNIARVGGGVALNIVPDRCALDVGLRVLPGMRSADLVERVRHAVTDALGDRPFELKVTGDSPPLLLGEQAPILEALRAEAGAPDGAGVSFATDAGWLQRLGLDCAIFGPGTIEVAHRPNESLPIAEFVRAGQVLDRLVARFCERGR